MMTPFSMHSSGKKRKKRDSRASFFVRPAWGRGRGTIEREGLRNRSSPNVNEGKKKGRKSLVSLPRRRREGPPVGRGTYLSTKLVRWIEKKEERASI